MYRVHSELLHQEFTNCGPYPQVINLMLSDEPIINVSIYGVLKISFLHNTALCAF